jgi:penicillin-binding protein 1A
VVGNYLRYWCREHGYDLYDDGLKIYTTIDSRLQRYAEEALTEHMSKLQTTFEDHIGNRKPWINEDGSEMKGFLQNAMRRTRAYKNLIETDTSGPLPDSRSTTARPGSDAGGAKHSADFRSRD